MFNPLKFFRRKTVGIALGSGGAKGIAHIAVLEYLKTMGIPVNIMAGSSIGSVIASLYCCGTMDKFKEDLRTMTRKEMLSFFDPVFPRSGLLEGNDFIRFLQKYIPADARIEDFPVKLAITATDFRDGKCVIFRSGNVLEAVRASISIPGVLLPVKFKGSYLIDGGVANPLPINIVKRMGANLTVAVNLHPSVTRGELKRYIRSVDMRATMDARDVEIVKAEEPMELPVNKPAEKGRFLQAVEKFLNLEPHDGTKQPKEKLPSIFEILMKSFDIMEFMNTRMMLKYDSPTVLIEPTALEYGTLDFLEANNILNEGYKACARVRGQLVRKVKIWV